MASVFEEYEFKSLSEMARPVGGEPKETVVIERRLEVPVESKIEVPTALPKPTGTGLTTEDIARFKEAYKKGEEAVTKFIEYILRRPQRMEEREIARMEKQKAQLTELEQLDIKKKSLEEEIAKLKQERAQIQAKQVV